MTPMLDVRDLTRSFGGLRAVNGASLSVAPGALVGLIGPNGAGKSTLFNLISGLIRPDSGSIRLDGAELAGLAPERIARLGVGRTFQTPRAFPGLGVMENLTAAVPSPGEHLLSALLGGYRAKEAELAARAAVLLDRVGLGDRARDGTDRLSGGELRMLEVARQLMRQPRLLLLDEPTAGVGPVLQGRLAALLRQLHDDGLTMVVVEHNLRFLLDLAERVVVMVSGSVLMEGTPEEVRRHPEVISAYLGGGADAA